MQKLPVYFTEQSRAIHTHLVLKVLAMDIDEFEHALEKTGYGKFNLVLLTLVGLIQFTVCMDSYSTGFILPPAQCEMDLTTAEKGALTTVTFLGTLCSSHLWGFIADTRGRKNILIITLLLSFICTLLSSITANFFAFAVLRFLSGFFMQGPSFVAFVYLAEFEAAKNRSRSITCTGIYMSFAIIALPALAWIILQENWVIDIFGIIDFKPWRLFLLFSSAPSILFALVLLPFPESPKFLLQTGKTQEALDVLAKVYSYNTGREKSDFPIKSIKLYIEEEEEKKFWISLYDQTVPLFKSPHFLNTLVVCTLQFGTFVVSSGLFLWYPDIVNQLASHSSIETFKICDAISFAPAENVTDVSVCSYEMDSSVFIENLYLGIAYIIGYVGMTCLINLLGKCVLLVFCMTAAGLAGLSLLWVSSNIAIEVFFVNFLVLPGICECLITAAVVDLYPTKFRAMAVSVSLMSAKLGSIASSSVIGIFLEVDCTATFAVLASVVFGCALLSVMIPNFTVTKNDNYNK